MNAAPGEPSRSVIILWGEAALSLAPAQGSGEVTTPHLHLSGLTLSTQGPCLLLAPQGTTFTIWIHMVLIIQTHLIWSFFLLLGFPILIFFL